jgi:hypothetical protein
VGVDPIANARALAALGALLLLPGLTVVRAPWHAVPFLSLAYWVVSWSWLDALGATRRHFLVGSLLFFAALASLRLFKPWPRPRPSWAAWLVALAALAQLLPLTRLTLGPGDDGPLRALTVRLLIWHDGLPRTYEPLAPVHHFGAGLHGVDLLAADVALLASVPPVTGALVAALAAQALLLVALDALLTRALAGTAWAPALARGASALAVLSVAGLRAAGLAPAVPSTLGLALGVSAAALLLRGRERAPAVAAGLLLGGALVSDPLLLALVLPVTLSIGPARAVRAAGGERRAQAVRAGLACGFALLLAAPALLRFDVTLSPAERAAAGPLVLTSEHLFGIGWVLAALAAAWGLAYVSRRVEEGADGRFGLRRAVTAAAVLVGALGTAWGAAHVGPRLPPSAAERRALEALAAATTIDDVVCIDAATPQVWIPALVGRAVHPALLPGFYADELRAGVARRPACVPAS